MLRSPSLLLCLLLLGSPAAASVSPQLTQEQKARKEMRAQREAGGNARAGDDQRRAGNPKAKNQRAKKPAGGARPQGGTAPKGANAKRTKEANYKPLPTPESREEMEHLAVVRRVLDEEQRHDENIREILVLRREAVERGQDNRVESLDIFLEREIQRHREFLELGRGKVGPAEFDRAVSDARSWLEKGELPLLPGAKAKGKKNAGAGSQASEAREAGAQRPPAQGGPNGGGQRPRPARQG